jgi:hypothetical protein
MQKAVIFALLLFTPCLLALPALPLGLGGGDKGGSALPLGNSKGGKSDCKIVGGLLDGDLKVVFQVLGLDANLDGIVGDLVSLIRCVLEKVIQILQKLLPKLNTTQLDKLTKLLANPEMTKSEILQTIDGWIAGEPIELQEFYNQTVTDVEDKAEATLNTLIDISNGISPELGDLVKKISDIVLDDVITLLHENEAIGKLVSDLLGDVDKLADKLLKNLDNLLCSLLNGLGLDGLLDLTGLQLLDGLIKKGGLLGLVADLLNSILGGDGNGILGQLLGGSLLGGGKSGGLPLPL